MNMHVIPFQSVYAADRTTSYFTEIGNSFGATSFTSEKSLYVIGALCGIIGVLLGVIAIMSYLKRKHGGYVPAGWVMRPADITRQIQSAIDARRKVELQFHTPGMRRHSTSCSAIEIEHGTLLLECSGLSKLSPKWIGRHVECFFSVVVNKRVIFYTFVSTIAGIRMEGENICMMNIRMPEVLEQRQKRSFLRIEPPEQYVLGMALWAEKLDSSGRIPLNVKEWDKPELVYIPNKTAELELVNLSAGGARIKIRREVAKKCNLTFTIAERFILLLDLWEPELGKRDRYWLLCRTQTPFIDFETRNVDLGVQFIGLAKNKENSTHELVWVPFKQEDGIEVIGNWAMKRHLELYREKGLEE
ncbi:hypothetical protein [Oleidesulfovibrio sp.]|uniref:hypothetical protein n=1 Tax=Oleidesulfovibrio sp. TaxID=2909707 RepID=UPI003A87B61C